MMNGKIIDGRYEIIEETGRGGMAIVYLAKCLVLNRYVAIKMLRPEYRDDTDFVKRFKIEAQSAGGLSHPNIVSVYDVGQEDDMEYIVMEYVDGITLKQYLGAKGVLQWKEAVDYASQICSGLEHAHKKGIVHKDIKPENVMITKEGILKITDFGIAKALNQGTIASGGLTMGSVHYFSPEQARGGYIDAKTDLYSLGVLLYEMVAGRLPFEGETAISVAMQHIESAPVRPSVFNPSIPKSLEAVILKAMKKEQTERYQSATQMLIDLKKVYIGSEVRYDNDLEMTKKFKPIQPETRPQDKAKKSTSGQSEKPPAKKPVKRPMTKEEIAKAKKAKKQADAMSIVSGICAGIIVIALVIWGWSFMKGGSRNEIECPELVNLTPAQALELIEGTKLRIVQKNGSDITIDDEGIIVTQTPKSGKKIKDNSKITITLGDAPAKTEKVPAVSGMTESKATSALRSSGFEVVVERKESNDVEEGKVISSHPSGGTSISEGSVVTIYVSTGSKNNDDEYTIVPSVLGQSQDEAKATLERAGLMLGEVQQITSGKPQGTVVKQSEAEGNRVKKNKAIDIRISNGKGTTQEPTTPPQEENPNPNPNPNPDPAPEGNSGNTSEPSPAPTNPSAATPTGTSPSAASGN